MNDLPDHPNNDNVDDMNLQDLWQETPPVNVDDLVKSVKSAHRKMRFYVYYELASSVFGIFLFVWIFKENLFEDQLWIPILLGALVFLIQAWAFTWRRGLWNAFARSPEELFQLKRRHLFLDIKVARSIYGGIVGGGAVGALAAYFSSGDRHFELSEFARGSILTLVACSAVYFFIWGVRKEIKARKQLKELEKQIKEYESFESL
ncbi:MAG: hypothetical protein AB8G18_05955 [Gammaproteobacteria bacterium]